MNDAVRFPLYLRLPGMGEEGEGGKEDAGKQEADGGKTYDEKYVKELREENKKRREENQTLKKEMDDFRAQQSERDKALRLSLGIKDDKEDPVGVLRSQVDTLTKKLEESDGNIAKEKLFNTFTGEALKAGVNPDLIGDAWKLTDGVTFENVKEVVAGLKENKPFLFAKGKEDMGANGQPVKKKEGTYPDSTVQLAATLKLTPEFLHKKIEEKAKKDSISYDDAMRKYWGVNPKGSLIARVFGGN